MSFMYMEGPKKMHRGVNTDPLQISSSFESKQSQYGLKERSLPHIKIAATEELKVWYEIDGKIGEGAFGTVTAITEKGNKKKWAMKTVTKSTASVKRKTLSRTTFAWFQAGRRLKLVQQEIQILKLIQHPHIIFLEKVFESSKHIYMIFEKCNGDFARIYKERKPFAEKIAKKIFSELVDAVAYLHKYDIVHRDLKMENILLGTNPTDPTDEYYIKLTDFGLSIVQSGKGVDSMLHELCGTIQYIAPEMITLRSYSQTCDMWSVGVILYMLVMGTFPFYSKDEKELQKQICTQEPKLNKSRLSEEICDLISLLLVKDPVKRIRATEVLEHPWVQNKKMSKAMYYNIMEKMKEWKSEMTVQSGAVSDWVAAPAQQEPPKNTQKQPMSLPKTNINFQRRATKKGRINETPSGEISREASKFSHLNSRMRDRASKK